MKTSTRRKWRIAALISLALLLTACGGGGDGGNNSETSDIEGADGNRWDQMVWDQGQWD